MTATEKKAYLVARGWSTWYNEDYWVNPKVITNPEVQDYTDYGMTLDAAYRWESKQQSKIPPLNERILAFLEKSNRDVG